MRTDEQITAMVKGGKITSLKADELERAVKLMERGSKSTYKSQDLDEYAQTLREAKDGADAAIRPVLKDLLSRVLKQIPAKHVFELKVDSRGHGICKFTEIHRREKDKDGKVKTVLQDDFRTYRDIETPKISV